MLNYPVEGFCSFSFFFSVCLKLHCLEVFKLTKQLFIVKVQLFSFSYSQVRVINVVHNGWVFC